MCSMTGSGFEGLKDSTIEPGNLGRMGEWGQGREECYICHDVTSGSDL